MKRMFLWIGFIILCLAALSFETASAAGKPNVTRHEAKYLENAVNMHIEWQSPNPVTLVKVSMPGVAKELAIDPYDNRRNPDGYSGEVDVTLTISGLTGQAFTYVVQLQDELRLRSEPVTGQVKIPMLQQPGMMVPPGMMPPGAVPPGMTPPGAQLPGMTPTPPPPVPDAQTGATGPVTTFPPWPGGQGAAQPGGIVK